jgi:hypothetical protein
MIVSNTTPISKDNCQIKQNTYIRNFGRDDESKKDGDN